MTDDNKKEAALAERFEKAALGFARDRNLCADILVEFGTTQRIVRIRQGKVEEILDRFPLHFPWAFAVRAGTEAWEAHWERFPAPGLHDIFALAKQGKMRMEGNMQPFFAHLQFIKDMLATPRKEA
ncbi:MAG: hypothetical protein LBR31_05785 [Desulfovibrio sp.]|nr:hypothetical protein [Desulfovibrio sp.]